MTHICVGKLTIIGSDNGLSPGRCQAIIWTNAGILLIGLLGTNLSEILIEIDTFSFKKMHLKMSSAKCRPFCLGLNVLTHWGRGKMIANLQTEFSNAFLKMSSAKCRPFCLGLNVLTHWGRDKMIANLQTEFSNAFSCMKISEYQLGFNWSLFLMVKLTIFQHWFR